MDSPETAKDWRCSECGQTGPWVELRAHGNHYHPDRGGDFSFGIPCAINGCDEDSVGTMDWPDQFTHVPLCRKHGETFTPEQLPVR